MMNSLFNYSGYFGGPRGFGGICGMNGGFLGGFHMIFWLILIGAIVYFIYQNQKKNNAKINNSTPQPRAFSTNDEALKQLAMRYANGEIDEETYVKMKNQLKD